MHVSPKKRLITTSTLRGDDPELTVTSFDVFLLIIISW